MPVHRDMNPSNERNTKGIYAYMRPQGRERARELDDSPPGMFGKVKKGRFGLAKYWNIFSIWREHERTPKTSHCLVEADLLLDAG
jgi:hypothetical protein